MSSADRADRKPEFTTSWGTPRRRLYGPADVPPDGAAAEAPGQYPFTRGVHEAMYRSRLWTMRQYAGFGSAAETNKRYRFLLDQGQTGLSVAFDLPTQMGHDPDAPIAQGEVGKVGVSIAALEDMADLFEGIPLDRVSTSMTINATAAILLASTWRSGGVRRGLERLSGTTQTASSGVHRARNSSYRQPSSGGHRLLSVVPAASSAWNTISISGITAEGSTALQEVAFSWPRCGLRAGAVEARPRRRRFAPRCVLFNAKRPLERSPSSGGTAAVGRSGASGSGPHRRSQMLRFHAQTAGSMLTAQQPENNIVRVTVQALAAVLGGCQSLHTNSMDETLALPTERAVRIALRTQQILANESGVADTVDPLGGSFAVERLTRDIEEHAEVYIKKIDDSWVGEALGSCSVISRTPRSDGSARSGQSAWWRRQRFATTT